MTCVEAAIYHASWSCKVLINVMNMKRWPEQQLNRATCIHLQLIVGLVALQETKIQFFTVLNI